MLADGSLARLSWQWQEKLAALAAGSEPVVGDPDRLLARWSGAFGAGYQELFDPDEALLDIAAIEDMEDADRIAVRSYRLGSDPGSRFRFKLYRRGSAVPLADVLAILEPMGLKALVEEGFPLRPSGQAEIWVHEFLVDDPRGEKLVFADIARAFETAFLAIWSGAAENDGFNRLVLETGASWHEAAIIRALARYRQQSGIDPSQRAQVRALVEHARLTRLILDLFAVKFDPANGKSLEERQASANHISKEIEAALQELPGIEEDRVLRRLYHLVGAAKRTNAYVPAGDLSAQPCIALKISSRELDDLPDPTPFMEIFVSSPRVEGVHMRFGPVARGGLRWSDRADDFRTETLALAKAQQVKNSVIVPVGAKGAFVAKAAGGEARDGADAYRRFITAMLEVTDNIGADGTVISPAHVIVHDEEDPYLVVAADKGTAAFSDLANEVAAERGFWLGDAFASGGSAGYDHKAMAITARGAWVAATRHFREAGIDIETDGFTVVGVGDMSGDVFGNFMLRSKHARLVAAFDHRDIFIDPDPDAGRAWRERRRLFRMGGSTWQDYDRALLSEGGGVHSRNSRSIQLSPQARAALGIAKESLTPDALIQVILKAPVDLLFMGGIGTYVKASSERNHEAGDRSNDSVRIDAGEARATIVVEGANLGVTQAGRIELAAAGKRINTDGIDNSAGVASSDLEVNIKILLENATREGELDPAARIALLKAMTDSFAERTLAINHAQTLALSLVEAEAAEELGHHAGFIAMLERTNRLSREAESLPSDAAIELLRNSGRGLTRPELAVLMAHGKLHVFDLLLDSAAPDDPWCEQYLRRYFPGALEEFPRAARAHRLRREIIATELANEIVDIAGPTFVARLSSRLGRDAGTVALAFAAAGEIFGLRTLWRQVGELDGQISPDRQYPLYRALARSWRRQTSRLAARVGTEGVDVAQLIERYAWPVAQLRVIADERHAAVDKAKDGPSRLAREIESLAGLDDAIATAGIAIESARPMSEVAELFETVGARFGFTRLKRIADEIATTNVVDQLAVRHVAATLRRRHERLCRSILEHSAARLKPSTLVEGWAGAQGVGDVRRAIDALGPESTPWTLGRLLLADAALERIAA
jgi:glutamate dehydrogenase